MNKPMSPDSPAGTHASRSIPLGDALLQGEPLVRIVSGIPGFDDILYGGMPKGSLFLVEGHPGTGKTTLALQFLLAGVSNGERVLYITLSESKQELTEAIRSHRWPADALLISEIMPRQEDLNPETQYTVFHPSEVELAAMIAAILQQIDAVRPQRLVFDSLSELSMLAHDPLKYRRQILALKRHLAQRDCTVMLLDDATGDESTRLQLQSIAHGVIQMENLERAYGGSRRRMQICKLRASAFREGYHDYTIGPAGIQVYPRLIAAEHRPTFESRTIRSGLLELDELFGGGLDAGTSTLLVGPSGCGKSSIAFRYALTAAEQQEKAVIFTFDEAIRTMMTRCISLGMDATASLNEGWLEVHRINPVEFTPGQLIEQIRHLVVRQRLRMLILDSMNGLLNAMPYEPCLAMQLHELFAYLNQQGVVTIVTLTQHGLIGRVMNSPIDVSYFADTVLLFRFYQGAGDIRQALSVVKKRSGSHKRSIRELSFEKGRLRVGKPLTHFEGFINGSPRATGTGGAG